MLDNKVTLKTNKYFSKQSYLQPWTLYRIVWGATEVLQPTSNYFRPSAAFLSSKLWFHWPSVSRMNPHSWPTNEATGWTKISIRSNRLNLDTTITKILNQKQKQSQHQWPHWWYIIPPILWHFLTVQCHLLFWAILSEKKLGQNSNFAHRFFWTALLRVKVLIYTLLPVKARDG